MPDSNESIMSARDVKRPAVHPKTADTNMTPNDDRGISARLKGEGNSCPVADRSTAWGTVVKATTTATYSTKMSRASLKPNRSR